MRSTIVALAVGLGLAAAGPLSAQGRPIELGLDAGFTAKVNDIHYTSVDLPIQQLRIGFFVADEVEIEPALAFNWFKVKDADAVTHISGDLGLLLHFTGDASRARAYLRPVVGITHLTSGGDGATAVRAGLGIGVKVPVRSAPRFAFRFEGGFVHGFENTSDGVPSQDLVQVLVGFSFLTK